MEKFFRGNANWDHQDARTHYGKYFGVIDPVNGARRSEGATTLSPAGYNKYHEKWSGSRLD
jgi:hypothetical protein